MGSLEGIPNKTLSSPILAVQGSSASPEASFTNVRAALYLDDGRLVLVDGGSRRLKLYDAEGSFVRVLGEGASQTMAVRALWPADADTVIAYDERARLVLEVPLDGSDARTWSVESARLNARAIGRLKTGQVLLRSMAFEAPKTGFDTTMVSIAMYSEGQGVDTLGTWPSSRKGRVGEPPFQLVTDALFEPGLAAAAGLDQVVIAECRDHEFTAIWPLEDRESVVRWPGEVANVTSEDMQAYLLRMFEGTSGADREQLARIVESTPVSATMPVCDQVRVDALGRTWIRSFVGPAATRQRWLVFGRSGEPLFRLDLPVTTFVVALGSQHITVVEIEADGQQRVVVYELE